MRTPPRAGGTRPGPVLAAALLAAALLAAALLTGCSGGSGGSGSATRGSSGPGSATGTGTPVPTVVAPASETADDAPVLLLQGDGLGLLASDASVEPLPFGTTAREVLQDALERTLGPVAASTLTCPQGPRDALVADGFRVLLDGGAFVGWTDTGAAERSLTTADGVGTGSRLDELQSAVPDAVLSAADGGGAFTSPGGLSGTLDGLDPGSTVTSTSGGQTCPGA